MPPLPKVCISILNWNRLPDTLACLESVFNLDYPNFEVIVVDNHSSESPEETIRRLHPGAKLIINRANIGFTGGNNVAMAYAMQSGADYIWLLNNDTVVEPNSLRRLVEYAEANDSIGLVSPLIYYLDDMDRMQFAGSRVDWRNLRLTYPSESGDNGSFQEGEDVCLWGTALLVRRRVVEKVGYLNEDYFAYWEDTEYSLRSLRNGFRNAVCTSAKIYHDLDSNQLQTGGRKPHFYYFMCRNRLLLGHEYLRGVKARFEFLRQFLATMLCTLGLCHRNGNVENTGAVLNGAWHGLRSLSGPMTSKDQMPNALRRFFLLLARGQPFLLANVIMLDWRAIAGQFSRLRARLRESAASKLS
ncbi:MAG: glycosyltransferase family 2 protein [Deltaproteobacteria bacterium]|jgi:GT2 family glycosyltransferase|nr:glycosyltransferase family 2 protein [Deltaproteobacteria bacterium]